MILWLNIRHLIDYDLGVLMYKKVNGLGPEICKESFHDIGSIQVHATMSAVKGVPRKTTSIVQPSASRSCRPKAMEHDTLYNKECTVN